MGYGTENPMYTFTWFGRQVNIDSLRDYWQRGYEGTKQFHFNSGWNDNPFSPCMKIPMDTTKTVCSEISL